MKKMVLLSVIALLLMGCNRGSSQKSTTEKEKTTANYSGSYVDENYAKRTEGYDWVSVAIKTVDDKTIQISVRSRADKKKPTCTFDATAYKKSDSIYQAAEDGKTILFTFTGNKIVIATEKFEDSAILNFYCSGGGSLAGEYTKINESLDQTQVDKTTFSKVLSLQGIGFNISSTPTGNEQQLTVSPFGLSETNESAQVKFKGEIIGAEAEDLNADGSPEVFIYTQSGDNKTGNVIAFSVNNKKSMSAVSFPATAENTKINKGYNGHDMFSIIEKNLVQRFPLFENGKETGKIRQVSYRLKDGEAMRKLEVKTMTEQ